MSNSVTNVEIEDVLSSIRRLVSEETRPRKVQSRPETDRLVLSPALRVPEAQAETESLAEDTAADPEDGPPVLLTQPAESPRAKDAPVPRSGLSDAIQTSILVLEPAASDPEEQATSDTVNASPDAVVEDGPRGGLSLTPDDEADMPTALDGGGDDLPEDPSPEDLAEAEQIAALRASLSGILSPAPEEREGTTPLADADGYGTADVLEDPVLDELARRDVPRDIALDLKIASLEKILQKQAEAKTQAEAAVAEPQDGVTFEPVSDAEASEAAQPLDDDPIDMDSQISSISTEDDLEMEGPEGLSASPPEPPVAETPSDDSHTPGDPPFRHRGGVSLLDWRDDAAAEASGTDPVPAPEVQDSALADLDEETLQALVADIVRQELQGALGERITRNVRKLVRREIHRVLMSQDLE
jgi:hypothetical protein